MNGHLGMPVHSGSLFRNNLTLIIRNIEAFIFAINENGLGMISAPYKITRITLDLGYHIIII